LELSSCFAECNQLGFHDYLQLQWCILGQTTENVEDNGEENQDTTRTLHTNSLTPNLGTKENHIL
jgi:hypothetical protein